MTEWQSIETAPKDGTRILTWCPKNDAIVLYYDFIYDNNNEKQWFWKDTAEHMWGHQPSHWIALPKAPE